MGKSKPKTTTQDGVIFLDEFTKDRLETTDGWRNSVTGMGIVGRDKGESTAFAASGILDQSTLDELGRSDGLANKIFGDKVDDAMRSGWTLSFKGDNETEVTPEQVVDFNERLTKWYKSNQFKSRVTQHLKQSRLYGGSLLVLGAMDGQDASEPLNAENVKEFSWLRAHDRYHVVSSAEINRDPRSVGFSFPKWYRLHSAQSITSGEVADRNETLLDTDVHNSRVWRTDGAVVSERVRIRNQGWGDSVLEQSKEPLANHASAMKSARTIVQEWVQGVYKIKNLQGIINANGEEKLQKRFHFMDLIRSMWQAVMVEAGVEEYERKVVTASGLPETLDRFMIHLSAVSGQPMTKLFGVSPGGFGTGQAEGDNWDDQVKAYQTDFVEPLLEYVHGILFQTPEFQDFPSNWSIRFSSLQLTDPVEDADIRLKTAQKDALEIQAGIVGADEVAHSRYGGSTYSTETQLDEAGRAELEELEAEGLGDVGAEALNGIQITSLLDILERVKTGVLPKESAKVAIQVSLPQVTPEAINGMVDPIEVTGPVNPEATPAAPPPFAQRTSANPGDSTGGGAKSTGSGGDKPTGASRQGGG